jgi:hypothetical protein
MSSVTNCVDGACGSGWKCIRGEIGHKYVVWWEAAPINCPSCVVSCSVTFENSVGARVFVMAVYFVGKG